MMKKRSGSEIATASVQSVFFLILSLSTGCSLTSVRPVQEMSNAEVAIKAAKDLNADSLTPELYRRATDSYYKAKREYRLKNFENARKFATNAMRYAEKAEFEAYRLGGATPEASTKLLAPEGAGHDPEEALQEGLPKDEPLSESDGSDEEPASKTTRPPPPSEPEPEASPAPGSKDKPNVDKGTDYNEYLKKE